MNLCVSETVQNVNIQKAKGVISKETVVLRRTGKLKHMFGFINRGEANLATVKRFRNADASSVRANQSVKASDLL